MLTWFKQNMLSMFFRTPLSVRITDEQYQTDIDLLLAAHNAEEWAVRRDMLKARKERLSKAYSDTFLE